MRNALTMASPTSGSSSTARISSGRVELEHAAGRDTRAVTSAARPEIVLISPVNCPGRDGRHRSWAVVGEVGDLYLALEHDVEADDGVARGVKHLAGPDVA